MLLVTFFFQETLSVNLVMLVNAFMFSIISIIGYCMQAAGQSVMQQLLLNTPRLLCAGLAIAFFLVFKYLAPLQTMLTAAFFISFIFTLALFYFKGFVIKYAPFKLLTNPSETKHYLLISCSAVLMAEGAMVILGMLGSKFDTAHFGVATRLVSLVAFVLLAFNSIVTPQFAQLYKQNKHKELVKRYQSARQQSIFISMSIALVFWWSADFLLGLFGTEYVQASGVMLVLLLTQLTKVFVGSAGQLLMMSDLVHLQKRCIVAGVLVMILGCCIFIPQYGALGAAISTFIGVAINNFLALFYANRYLSIPLGLASPQ
ncbi:MATE family efflux transporter [Pseudoalteromonas sp. A25]|uniref:MATE family efflux transporter n=1 Tax=Pseudoalteromonas sp. A25 TaxID=116092 RepID=UPI001561F581|nr:polysaccharide biosynthesis C-terminal domain-containing protein [Pseudoalteromonas sp. A25]